MANGTPQSETEKATQKEQHDLLIGLLKDHYTGLVSFEFSQAMILIVVIGWLITSESARSYIQNQPVIAYGMCAIGLMSTCFHAMWVYNFYRRSQAVFSHLAEMNYMPSEYFESRRIPRLTLIGMLSLHSFVTVILCIGVIFLLQ